METFGIYLLKSAVWLTGFTLVFLTVLRNERYFQLNRIYLLSGIVASLIFPLYTWHYTVIIPSETVGNISLSGISAQVIDTSTQSIPIYYWFYAMGIGWLAFRLIWQTVRVIRKLRQAGYEVNGSVKLVRTPDYAASFSFFSYVFVNPSTSDVETREIVNHEREHIEQRHWFDLLFAEILCLVQWFNPFVWVYAHLIRQNHEYLADEKALQRTSDPAVYRATLLNQLLGVPVISLANSFSYSLNKKRFKMMKKHIHSPLRKFKVLLILPLMALVFYAFAKPEYITSSDLKAKSDFVNLIKSGQDNKLSVTGKVVNADGKPLAVTSIVLRGSTMGTTTDENGDFKLTDVPQDGELVFSYVGYETVLTKADGENPRVIKMERTSVSIDKVVVVGYGEQKTAFSPPSEMSLIVNPPYHYELGKQVAQLERDFIKNSSDNPPLIFLDGEVITKSKMESINPDDIGVIKALKDQSATNKYGDKGKFGVIEIVSKSKMTGEENGKSANSITFDDPKKEPLIYVDGKITDYNTMRAIKSDQIESINVLKDKMATDKYGDKGKNGVLELTLKKKAIPEGAEVKYVVGYPITSHIKSSASPMDVNVPTKNPKYPPLYIINGQIVDKAMADVLNPETIESVSVLKDKSATDKYGDKGKNGVIEIKLKVSSPDRFANKKSDFGFVDSKTNDTIRMSAYGSMVFESGRKDSPALYILDGKVKDISEINKIDPESIKYITHLQGNDAIKKYGEKGKHGVIVIVTKKNPGASTDVEPKKANLFTVVEEMPQFVGGFNALMKFIGDNIQYPAQAKADKTEGTVIVNFVIKNNGKVENVKIDRGINPLLDKEAARVISILPEWIPGKQQGKAVDVSYTIPIQFKLDGNEQKKPVGLQKQSNEPYKEVEEMPQFPGGENALMHFIMEQVRYPKQAMLDNVTGKVLVNFIVTASGKIDRIKIAQGIRQDLDNEALRVIGLMPDWQPGKQDGKAVDVTFTIPIQFKLEAPDPNAAVVRPQFPGIENELTSFIANHVKYPEQAKKDRIEGTVAISFIVKTSGKIENIKVVRSVNPDLDAEAIRVVSLMPDWKPGTVNGKEANMGAYIPIQFKLK